MGQSISEGTSFVGAENRFADLFARQQARQSVVKQSGAKERIAKLKRLQHCALQYRKEIEAAIWNDFRKSPTETNISELGPVCGAIRYAIRRLPSWLSPHSVGTPLALFGTRSEIRYEPKGVCLILSPWNYPFNLSLTPLVWAIAAGNCAILKPSEYTPHSSALMRRMIEDCFDPDEVALVEGDAETAQALLELPFNHIYFTGSPAIGKSVMTAAARHLASVTLELGGKTPVIVDETANLDTAAEKIVWLKYMNAGQICIAVDYVLAHEKIYDALLNKIKEKIKLFYGETAEQRAQSPDFCRIVSPRHFSRLRGLLDETLAQGAQTAFGGEHEASTRYISPTVLTDVPPHARLWEEEIFGPLMPVRPVKDIGEACSIIQAGHPPLAMYIFSGSNRNIETVLKQTRSGGAVINDCAIHFYNHNLPFGGVNNSGIGKSGGRYGFEAFSNARGITRQNRIFPHTNLFHPPYNSKLARFLLEGVVKYF